MKLFKKQRGFDLTIRLNPFQWFSKPRHYRFQWEEHGSPTREGQTEFGPFIFSWFSELKKNG